MDAARAPIVLQPPGEQARNGNHLDFEFGQPMELPEARQRFREFFRNYRQGNIFIYRESLVRQWNRREFFIEVDLAHVNEFDEVLFDSLQRRPVEFLEKFESAAKDALKNFLTEQSVLEASVGTIPDFQVILRSSQLSHSLRNLTAEHVNKLIKVSVRPHCENPRPLPPLSPTQTPLPPPNQGAWHHHQLHQVACQGHQGQVPLLQVRAQ